MAIIKQNRTIPFGELYKTEPFAAKITLHTRSWEGKDDEREYLFFKIGPNKAMTVDKRTVVHFPTNFDVTCCIIEKKKAA